MFGLTEREKIEAREKQRLIDEINYKGVKKIYFYPCKNYTFTELDYYCNCCGGELKDYYWYRIYDTSTGEFKVKVYRGCPNHLHDDAGL